MKEKLLQLYNQVRDFLYNEIGLSANELAYKRDPIDEAEQKKVTEAIKWLEAFILVRITNYKQAYSLVPPDRWKLYEAIGTEGLWEQDQLKDAKEKLIADWRARPNLLRKKKDERFDRKRKRKKDQTNRAGTESVDSNS